MTHLENLEEGDTARIVYRSKRSHNRIEVVGEVKTSSFGNESVIGVEDEENDRIVVANREEGKAYSTTENSMESWTELGTLQEVSPANIYRVWLNESTPAGGDRRELARYKAFTMKQVAEAVKDEQFDDLPEHLDGGGIGDRMTLQWTETPSREETGLTEEEYRDAQEYGELGTTYTIEIEEDNTATFPMNLVTGGSAGKDLTR